MKANEAPEKIYVSTNINGEVFDNSWFWHNLHHSDVEYTRTDTFIEKACKWLQEEVVNDYAGLVWENLIEDFRKYMEEE